MVWEDGLTLPGFISDLKYLAAYKDYGPALILLQQFVRQNAAQQQQRSALLVLTALFGVIALMGSDQK
jgi:hypothetical protein